MDLFGNKKPVLIEVDEWWYNGRFIQKQTDPRLPTWISFSDDENDMFVDVHSSKKDAIAFADKHPCKRPRTRAEDYIGIKQT